MDYQVAIVVVSAVCGIAFAAMFMRHTFHRYHTRIRERMTPVSGIAEGPRNSRGVRPIESEGDASPPALATLLPTGVELQQFRERLVRAGIKSPLAARVFFATRLVGLILPTMLGLAAVWTDVATVKQGLLAGSAASCLGWMLPNVWLDYRIAKHTAILRRGIPDFLDLMIVCLKSGLSLPGTLQRVTEEISIAHPLLGEELTVVQREIDLGASVDRAFRDFADRSRVDVLRTLSTLVRESQRFGSELVVALRTQADNMRYQREQHAEEQAQRASVKILFPMLILILPAVFVVLAGPAAIQIRSAFAQQSQ